MKILARLLHLDRLLPAMDAKLLNLLLDGSTLHPTGLCSRSRARNPRSFGDFSRLTLAILNQTRYVSKPIKTSAIPFIPIACFAAMRSGFLPDVRHRACSLFPCPESGWLRYYRIQSFEIDNALISLD